METPRPFRLGYNTNTWIPTPNLDEMLSAIAGAGWEGVEFINISTDWLGTPTRLRARLDRYGLEPACMFGHVGSLEDDADQILESQRRLMEYAAELGCSVYSFTGALRVPLRKPTDDEFKRLAHTSETLIDYATSLGLTVAYHAHPRTTCESEEEQDRLLTYTERLTICVDVSVAALMGEDAIAQLRKYRDRLGYVHMKDLGRGTFTVMGQGIGALDFGKIRKTLIDIGYQGWVMGELSPYADTDAVESCYANREYLRSVGY